MNNLKSVLSSPAKRIIWPAEETKHYDNINFQFVDAITSMRTGYPMHSCFHSFRVTGIEIVKNARYKYIVTAELQSDVTALKIHVDEKENTVDILYIK